MKRVSFKDGVDPTDIFRFTRNCQILFVEVMRYFEINNYPLTITSLYSDRIGMSQKSISTTHFDGRAFDIRSRDLWAPDVPKIVDYFNQSYSNIAPTSITTGKKRCSVFEGDHIHFQVAR